MPKTDEKVLAWVRSSQPMLDVWCMCGPCGPKGPQLDWPCRLMAGRLACAVHFHRPQLMELSPRCPGAFAHASVLIGTVKPLKICKRLGCFALTYLDQQEMPCEGNLTNAWFTSVMKVTHIIDLVVGYAHGLCLRHVQATSADLS